MERTISKSGWFYKFFFNHLPEKERPVQVNVCQIATAIIRALFWLVVDVIIVLYVINTLGIDAWPHLSNNEPVPVLTELLGVLVMAAIAAAGIAIIFVFLFVAWIAGWTVWESPISLLRGFLRAKKDKYCPTYKIVP